MQKIKKNFTDGPIFFRITAFTLPIILTGVLQNRYNMADSIIVDSFPGDPNAVAAVGATTSLYHLILNLILGTSAGAGIVVAQRFGARKYDRVKKILLFSLIQVTFVGVLLAQTELLFGEQLASPFIDANDPKKPEIIMWAMAILRLILNTYFICGIMGVFSGALKGLGVSISPMIISLLGVCAFRLTWIYAIFFPSERLTTITEMLFCFPLSWIITAVVLLVAMLFFRKKYGILKAKAKKQSKSL